MDAAIFAPGRRTQMEVDQLGIDVQRFPNIADLMARLHFAPGDGCIWLDDQRMQLIHASAMGILRRELIEGLGIEKARILLTRMGYNSGAHDAELARKLRPQASLYDMFSVGPQLHALEGVVHVEEIRTELDVERGKYYGEYHWKGSSEVEEHIRYYGIGTEAVCWMQIGYASGYASAFMGRPILFREVECRGAGHPHCRIIGRPLEEWGDIEDDLNALRAEQFGKLSAAPLPLGRGATGANTRLQEHGGIVGISAGFNAVCHMINRVADTRATVLFLGESGVGKEVFAQTLHHVGPRAAKPFVAVNCAAIPEPLIESELFGVERGGYTGATSARPGRFERAHTGTLFLDEIGILSLSSQGKLLRALQQGEIERVGDTHTRKVDVRVVAATNLDLRDEVRAGRFREDLYFRLNVFPIKVPPLRERREDIPVLMNHFLRKFCQQHNRNITGFTARAIDALLSYELPGNIRELENMIERGVILAPDNGAIEVAHLFTGGERSERRTFGLCGDGSVARSGCLDGEDRDQVSSIKGAIDSFFNGAQNVSLDDIELSLETLALDRAMARSNGNISAAARLLGITRSRLVYRLNNRKAELAQQC